LSADESLAALLSLEADGSLSPNGLDLEAPGNLPGDIINDVLAQARAERVARSDRRARGDGAGGGGVGGGDDMAAFIATLASDLRAETLLHMDLVTLPPLLTDSARAVSAPTGSTRRTERRWPGRQAS
jgi:hypothetical protein